MIWLYVNTSSLVSWSGALSVHVSTSIIWARPFGPGYPLYPSLWSGMPLLSLAHGHPNVPSHIPAVAHWLTYTCRTLTSTPHKMGRSVSSLSRATHLTYVHLPDEDGEENGYLDFSELLDDMREALSEALPSLDDADRWDGREDHIIAENRLVEVAVSEYCGLMCVSARPRQWEGYRGEPTEAMGEHWLDQVWPKVEKVASYYGVRLNRLGGMSNGESVYAKA